MSSAWSRYTRASAGTGFRASATESPPVPTPGGSSAPSTHEQEDGSRGAGVEMLIGTRHRLGRQVAVEHAEVDGGYGIDLGGVDPERLEAGPLERVDVGVAVAVRRQARWWVAPLPFLTEQICWSPVTERHHRQRQDRVAAMGLGLAWGHPESTGGPGFSRAASACRTSGSRTRWRCPPRSRSARRSARTGAPIEGRRACSASPRL